MSGRIAAHIYNKKKRNEKRKMKSEKRKNHFMSAVLVKFHNFIREAEALCLLHKTLFDRFTSRLCFLSPAIPTSAEFY